MGKKINNKKSADCEGRWCQTHHFLIRSVLVTMINPKEESIRLCPKFNREQKKFERVLPMLNPDHKYYTPLFILEEDQRLYIDHDKSSLRNFQNSKLSEEYQISQIMVPKVNTSNAYCRICRQDYADYLPHIQSQRHCQNVSRHPYSTFIVELVENFKTNGCQQKQSQKLSPSNQNIKPEQPFLDFQMESQLLDKETAFRLKESLPEKNSYQPNL